MADLTERDAAWAEEQQRAEQMREESKSLVVTDSGVNSMLMDSGKFTQALRAARLLANSTLVPDHFRGEKNVGNCFIGLQLAARTGIDVFMVLQNLYVVHGRPGLQAKIMIAAANAKGPFTGPIQWELERDKSGRPTACTAFAVHESTGERCEYRLTWEQVQSEGWDKKPGSKWQTIPEKMFKYRSAAWLIDLYCPEVIMGLPSADDLLDANPRSADGAEVVELKLEGPPEAEDPNADVPVDLSKPKDDPPEEDSEGLTLEALESDRAEAGISNEVWQDQMIQIGISATDKRTQTEKRLLALDAFISDWKRGGRE